MRILLIGPFAEGLLPETYARAFARLGHEVGRFDSDRAYFRAAWYAGNRLARRLARPLLWGRVNRQTLQVAEEARPELIVVFKGSYLDAQTVGRLRDGSPVVNYYPDNPYCGVPFDPRKTSAQRRNLIEVLREYTRLYTWERGLVARLRADGVDARYLPFGADTPVYRPSGCNGEPRYEVAFIGQHDAKRQRHVEAIRAHAAHLWGARWSRAAHRLEGRHAIHCGQVRGAACARIYGAAAVSLNVLNDLNMPGHNMRTFEVPASAGAMLATFTEEQAAFFPPGEAALYYREPEELDDRIRRLLADNALRERIRRNGLRIAREHDYTRRAREMLTDLGREEAA
jgi:hypothetical protein